MDDTISRKTAIDALENNRFPGARYVDTGIKIAIRIIKGLPSEESRIIRCKDCKWSERYTDCDGMVRWWCAEYDKGDLTENDFCSFAERESDEE